MSADDARWMRRALELAERGAGETNPNPMVGCVIVRNGRVVGEGHHARAGGPHAEVVALERAGARARGATLYVNLEPCAHQGRTPPCAPRVAAAGIRRVVAAMRDPNRHVNGRGFALLRRAGVAVAAGVFEDEALLLNSRFVVAARKGRPFVLLKAALTLDGQIATASGESKWITSAAQRREARRLRRLHDAALVGINTVLADDPLLLPAPRLRRRFVRVVLDSRLRLPVRSRLVGSASPRTPVWVLCHDLEPARRSRLESRGVTVIPDPFRSGILMLDWVLAALWKRGVASVMVEGGSDVLGSFLYDRLFDEVALFRAPLLLGGRRALPAFGGPDPERLADAVRLSPASPLLRQRSAPVGAGGPGLYEVWYPRR